MKSVAWSVGIIFALLLFQTDKSYGQKDSLKITKDSINTILKTVPSFTVYKDNYFITGTTLQDRPSAYNSDAKFQISFSQRFSNAVLPFRTILYMTYTQVSFWNIYRASQPFAESNYNPTLGLRKLIFHKGKLSGIGSLQFEHQSNGKQLSESRNWNFVSLSYSTYITKYMRFGIKGWIPFACGENPDLIRYVGLTEAKFTWLIHKEKWLIDLTAKQGDFWDGIGSFQTQVSFKPFKNVNEYLFLQWYLGYAENLANYKQSVNMLRIGIAIKSFNINTY